MTAKARMFNRGSILPSVLEIETELAVREREARENAENILKEAKNSAESIIEKAKTEVRRIDREEREKLLNTFDDRVEELERVENERLELLMSLIENNRIDAINTILERVIPGTTD